MGSGGLGRDGGLAEYMVAPANCLIPLRDPEPWQAAALTDAGLRSYHAVKRCLPILTPDTTAVVIGVGGLGQMAIQFLRELCGAQIIAMARSEKSLKMAETLGAQCYRHNWLRCCMSFCSPAAGSGKLRGTVVRRWSSVQLGIWPVAATRIPDQRGFLRTATANYSNSAFLCMLGRTHAVSHR